ncbi:AraC family transcriptional regulator [Jiangella rhizosphaerae]|uniref:AraC family transcriptional regulator n=1 Tax=Jiangella rhizosphaerae TaxID=2293569 RepID=A0A418KMZ4_9ACTN|nr:AraC family transcriptional regulator [Jiangella rhizosphaerae]RIQ20280.1 AraC family transcriptional regulator [Jiangella rhizosphaerae]
MPARDGLRQQRLYAVPRRQVTAALSAPVTRRLVVTDAGHSPAPAPFEASRPAASRQTVVAICAAGSGWADIGGRHHRIGAGAALVVPAGTPHAYGGSPSSPWTVWWCHLRGSDVPELVEALGPPVVPVRHLDRAVALADEIVGRLARDDEGPARLVGVAGTAWKLLTQLIADRGSAPSPAEGPLERAMDYLASRLDGTVRVPELAALVGVSPSHLTTLFRRATGGGVHAYQTTLRMERARLLLTTTEATVSEIARDVGYADPFHFSRQFRQLHAMSPTDYRRSANC